MQFNQKSNCLKLNSKGQLIIVTSNLVQRIYGIRVSNIARLQAKKNICVTDLYWVIR